MHQFDGGPVRVPIGGVPVRGCRRRPGRLRGQTGRGIRRIARGGALRTTELGWIRGRGRAAGEPQQHAGRAPAQYLAAGQPP